VSPSCSAVVRDRPRHGQEGPSRRVKTHHRGPQVSGVRDLFRPSDNHRFDPYRNPRGFTPIATGRPGVGEAGGARSPSRSGGNDCSIDLVCKLVKPRRTRLRRVRRRGQSRWTTRWRELATRRPRVRDRENQRLEAHPEHARHARWRPHQRSNRLMTLTACMRKEFDSPGGHHR